MPSSRDSDWVIVTGDIAPHGGQDRANFELARFLAERGDTNVHLVTHRADESLCGLPGVKFHRIPRPLNSIMLGDPLLDRGARWVANRVKSRGRKCRVVVNGGNCLFADVNWAHFVHAAWPLKDNGAPLSARARNAFFRRYALRQERCAFNRARLILANSNRTRDDLVSLVGVPEERVKVVYLGVDARAFRPAGPLEVAKAKQWLNVQAQPVISFVGALGYDARKGFDSLLSACVALWRSGWEGLLVAAGGGRLDYWQAHVARLGFASRVRLLGHTDRVSDLLAASDLLVSPTRYEPFGLNVHEAICRDVPAMVSASAGIAELYPQGLAELLIQNPEDPHELASRIRRWFAAQESLHATIADFGARLRSRSWTDMARDMVQVIEANS